MGDTQQSDGTFDVIQSAYDMKAVIILTCCDLIKSLSDLGDDRGAYALKTLIETIEHIPASTISTKEGE